MNEINPENLILFCDSAILVINKPAGLLSIPDGYHPEYPHVRGVFEPDFGRLYIVHRLDKDTSGVMVLARSPEAHRSLNIQFDERTTHKEYQALILGSPSWNDLQVDSPLTIDGDRAHRTRVFPGKGKAASTEFHLNTQWASTGLVTAFPHTGYTHQIRAHLSSIGFPILFDFLYTPPTLQNNVELLIDSLKINKNELRLMLHAYRITFHHPETGKPVEFTSPLPGDFLQVLDRLNKKKDGG